MNAVSERQDLGVTAQLAQYAANVHFASLPADVLLVARQCLLDWFAVSIAARHDPLVEILVAEALEEGGSAQASLVGRKEKVSRLQAALINGAASHALDYDDVHGLMLGHPTVTLVPGLLAAAQGRAVTGRQFIEAFVAGYETLIRVARLVNPAHYDHGFHATGTLGSIGAASACARLAGLDVNTTANAIGIAATSTSGLKSMFGTMCKPLHAGLAARNGLTAARLAARGFGSRTDALECEQGFAATHSSKLDVEAAMSAAPKGYHLIDNLFKYHAACYGTHGAIEATRIALAAAGGSSAGVRAVKVRASRRMQRVCAIANPQTGLEAKFSVRATVAFVLAGLDTAGIGSYSDERVCSEAVRSLIERVDVQWIDQPADMLTEVTLEVDGQPARTGHFDPGLPERDLAVQQRRLDHKFNALVAPEIGAQPCAKLAQDIARLETLPSIDVLFASLDE